MVGAGAGARVAGVGGIAPAPQRPATSAATGRGGGGGGGMWGVDDDDDVLTGTVRSGTAASTAARGALRGAGMQGEYLSIHPQALLTITCCSETIHRGC